MKKGNVVKFAPGTPEYVIGHARWQKSRNRQPSVSYRGEYNPKKALALAIQDIANGKIVKVNKNRWDIVRETTVIAQLHLDYNSQVNKIVLMNSEPVIRRSIKELALSHAIQFVIHRSPLPHNLLAMVPERDFREHTCENMMSFQMIPPGIKKLSDDELDKFLGLFATVVEGMFSSPEEMLQSLLEKIYNNKKVFLRVRDAKWSHMDNEMIIVTFESWSDVSFKAWNCSGEPNSSWKLHFSAPYYPSITGKKSFCMINGSTDAYIRGGDCGIHRVFSPEESRVEGESMFGSTWSKMKHPFYAEGKTLGVEFSSTLCMSKSGYDTLYDFLLAALNLSDGYVSISGGFNPPYDYPENVCNRKRIPSPAAKQGGRRNARGSEHNCVWEYQTLKNEGLLNKSQAPDWFHKEGWLNIYADEVPTFN